MEVHLGDPAGPVSCPVYRREDLGAGARVLGPALVREHGTTTVLFRRDLCSVARTGELLISVRGAE
jgi:N-methylhydantoinase A